MNNPFQQNQPPPDQTRPVNPFGGNRAQSQSSGNTVFGRSNNLVATPGPLGNDNGGDGNTNSGSNSNPFGGPALKGQDTSLAFGVSAFGTSNNMMFGSSINNGKNGGSNPFGTSPFGVGQVISKISNDESNTWGTSNVQSIAPEFTSTFSGTSSGFGRESSTTNTEVKSPFGRSSMDQPLSFGSGLVDSDVAPNFSPSGRTSSISTSFQQRSKANDTGRDGPNHRILGGQREVVRKDNPTSQLRASAMSFQPQAIDSTTSNNSHVNDKIKLQREEAAKKIATLKARIEQKRALLASKSTAPEKVVDDAECEEQTKFKTDVKQSFTSSNTSTISHEENNVSPAPSRKPKRELNPSCKTMCPSNEIEDRLKNNEISMLEQLHPKIFPSHFTLKNTCVKRFRRSAADVDLGKDEEVRDPITLETTMGFLEEWIMVSFSAT